MGGGEGGAGRVRGGERGATKRLCGYSLEMFKIDMVQLEGVFFFTKLLHVARQRDVTTVVLLCNVYCFPSLELTEKRKKERNKQTDRKVPLN